MALARDEHDGLEATVAHLSAGRAFTLQLLDSGPGVTLDEILHRPGWHADALCRERPDVNWFPGPGESADAARAVCARCPVRAECRRWAMDQGDDLHGLWGGLSRRERVRIAQPPSDASTGTTVAAAGECAVCARPGEVDVPDGHLCRQCYRRWRDKRRPTGPAFAAWAADRRTFVAAG